MENYMALTVQLNHVTPEIQQALQVELEKVRQTIQHFSKSKFSGIKEIVNDVIDLNGKMLRPTLTILSAHFGEYDSEKVVKLAASIEMLHMATLIHDDIIDDSKLRRNKESTQSKYGKDMAVYAGDYLLSKSLSMLNGKEYDADHMIKLAKAIELICESELLQFHSKFKYMTVKNYLRVVSGKTAALFAVSMYAGASESNCSEGLSKQLGKIGYELGVAFQIIDDILDYSDDQELVGKSTRNDLKKGYYTLPVIYAFQGESEKVLNHSEAELMKLVEKNNGIEKARVLARKYTKRAFKRIDSLPEGNYKEALESLAKALLDRKY
ncbi:polyprenyl synthetase family protein [Fusibacter bizertensis]|uniref:Polyprenyl synthetase family protein n=1 Tax=Fusibacter bizertensis TaxID=1488331 RepID=A0ABT6NFH6_9FIRM|nr:polyprenyl synthetase family protein [Fusibacter bizertensis]MDH8679142.1 polyprenyl synthetase family protein [Fusibacter bizertensis]